MRTYSELIKLLTFEKRFGYQKTSLIMPTEEDER